MSFESTFGNCDGAVFQNFYDEILVTMHLMTQMLHLIPSPTFADNYMKALEEHDCEIHFYVFNILGGKAFYAARWKMVICECTLQTDFERLYTKKFGGPTDPLWVTGFLRHRLNIEHGAFPDGLGHPPQ